MIDILVVEDLRVVREALMSLLSQERGIGPVAGAANAEEALAYVAQHRPDVAIVDIGLPGMSGLAFAEQMRIRQPDTRILILTALEKPGTVHEALRAGVHGFIPKGAALASLLDAVRGVHRGERVISPELVSAALQHGDNPLTMRERSALQIAADGASTAQIADQLHLAEGTVRNHLTRTIAKLSARNRVDAVRIAKGRGWL